MADSPTAVAKRHDRETAPAWATHEAATADVTRIQLPGASTVGRALAVAVALQAFGDAFTQGARVFFGHDYVFGFVRLLNLNEEGALGTWYAGATLLVCATILWVITAVKRRLGHPFVAHWGVLAAGFTFMSVDEVARIHDGMIGGAMQEHFDLPGGLMLFVIPGALISLAVLLSFISFLRHLPRRSGWLFLVAGAIYVGGAIGMESVGGAVGYRLGWDSWQEALCILLEETGEMVGVALFIYALLDYVERHMTPIVVRIGPLRGNPGAEG